MSRSSVPKFIRGNKLGEGVGDIYVRVALPSAPLSTLATHSADGPVLPVIGCAVRGNGRDIIVAVSEVSWGILALSGAFCFPSRVSGGNAVCTSANEPSPPLFLTPHPIVTATE